MLTRSSSFWQAPTLKSTCWQAAGGFSRAEWIASFMPKTPRSAPAALYELPANGSGKARKIFDIPIEAGMGSNVRMLFVSPTGGKIGYIRTSAGKQYFFLHETSTGKLLRKLDLTENMGNMSVTTIGWMPDETRLFFTLNRTDEDDEWTNPDSLMGSYVMKEDGTGREQIAPEEQLHPDLPGLNKDVKVSAVLLGVLPDGRLFASGRSYGSAFGASWELRLHTGIWLLFGPGEESAKNLSAGNARRAESVSAIVIDQLTRCGCDAAQIRTWQCVRRFGKHFGSSMLNLASNVICFLSQPSRIVLIG